MLTTRTCVAQDHAKDMKERHLAKKKKEEEDARQAEANRSKEAESAAAKQEAARAPALSPSKLSRHQTYDGVAQGHCADGDTRTAARCCMYGEL